MYSTLIHDIQILRLSGTADGIHQSTAQWHLQMESDQCCLRWKMLQYIRVDVSKHGKDQPRTQKLTNLLGMHNKAETENQGPRYRILDHI